MQIRRAVDEQDVEAAAPLFDGRLDPTAASAFLRSSGHHLLLAYSEVAPGVVGFVSGVETTHPDKGTEMLLYELAVDPQSRRQGIGSALIRALAALARTRGCYGMWVPVDAEDVAALATYRSAGCDQEKMSIIQIWNFGRGST